jgi:ubiquitin
VQKLQELDEQLYEDCKRAYEDGRQQEQQRLEARERKWHVLQQVAVQRAPK